MPPEHERTRSVNELCSTSLINCSNHLFLTSCFLYTLGRVPKFDLAQILTSQICLPRRQWLKYQGALLLHFLMFSKSKTCQKNALNAVCFKIRANISQRSCCFFSFFSLCLITGKHPVRQDKQGSTEIFFTETQLEGISISGLVFFRHNAYRNASLLRQKPCSSNGNVVSQFDAPLSLANSNAREYGVLARDCDTIFFCFRRAAHSSSVIH